MEQNQNRHEALIKVAIIKKLIKSGYIDNDSIIIDEFTVNRYERRVDIAIIRETSMIAFEIKSERDSLKRLEGQVNTFSRYFDKVIVVADTKHVGNIQHLLPSETGIWEFNKNSLTVKQRGRKRKITAKLKRSYLELLTVSELISLARITNYKLKDNHRASLLKELEQTNMKALVEFVISAISKRYRESTNRFLIETNNRNISVRDLNLLSKFKSERKRLEEQKQSLKKQWKSFNETPVTELLADLRSNNKK